MNLKWFHSLSRKLAVMSFSLGLSSCSSHDAAQVRNHSEAIPWDLGSGFLDIRGVGDTAWSTNHRTSPRDPETGRPFSDAEESRMGGALMDFDPDHKILRGDVNFVNWESVVGEHCKEFYGNRFLFLTHPKAISEALMHGFNVFGASNNHSRDCRNKEVDGERASEELTAQSLQSVLSGQDAIWAGSAETRERAGVQLRTGHKPRILERRLAGRVIRIAFNAIHLGRSGCPIANCFDDVDGVLNGFDSVEADIRMLSVHALEQTDKWKWIQRVGRRFLHEHSGDIVIGHGPHVWKPLLVEKKASGRYGVIFSSLGNFIHPGLVVRRETNAIARVLVDPLDLDIREVQWLSIGTHKEQVWFEDISPLSMGVETNSSEIHEAEDTVSFAGRIARRGIITLP